MSGVKRKRKLVLNTEANGFDALLHPRQGQVECFGRLLHRRAIHVVLIESERIRDGRKRAKR